MTSGSAHTRQSLDSSLTIEETKETKEQNRENYRKVFDVADLHCDEHRGREHDCRDGKSVGVRELRSIVERGDKDDRCYHNWRPNLKSFVIIFSKKKPRLTDPIDNRDIELSLILVRCVNHMHAETLHVR